MNKKKKILAVYGTRPEAIKMAPLVKVLKENDEFVCKVCVTAQHRSLLDEVNSLFEIIPDFDLEIYGNTNSITQTLSQIIDKMQAVLARFKPDIVLVHGDTTSTLAGALAAFYADIKIGHVEAGLRTNDTKSPWPEEGNRQLVSRIADFHFTPTQTGRKNLLTEGIPDEKIFICGNTVIDALLHVTRSDLQLPDLYNYAMQGHCKVLVTCHRRENFGKGIISVCRAIKELAITHPDWHFIFSVHPNPNVKNTINTELTNIENVFLFESIPYQNFSKIMARCDLIITDSGGIQEEAPSLGKPVLVLRDKTERPEAVAANTVKVIGTNSNTIVDEVIALMTDKSRYIAMSEASNPYGDGTACLQIKNILLEKL